MSDPTVCCACEKEVSGEDATPVASLPRAVRREVPRPCSPDGVLCLECATTARLHAIEKRLGREKRVLTQLENAVARKISQGEIVATHVDQEFSTTATAGQRIADSVARVGGSWAFVITACAGIVVWVAINGALAAQALDPFPYVLLNLILSCLAALQAPVILMAQNRAAARDRLQADHDYQVNLKTELEVAALHAKLDHLMRAQWDALLDVQNVQIRILEQLRRESRGAGEAKGEPHG